MGCMFKGNADAKFICIDCKKPGAEIHFWCDSRHLDCQHNQCLMENSTPCEEEESEE